MVSAVSTTGLKTDLAMNVDGKKRCFGEGTGKEFYREYHDREWGVPLHDDRRLFELLILEGAQAGLSWEIILKKREDYRRAFDRFDPAKIVKYDRRKISEMLANPGIVRNRLKISSTVTNALAFLEVQKEFGSFNRYLWSFVDGRPLLNRPRA